MPETDALTGAVSASGGASRTLPTLEEVTVEDTASLGPMKDHVIVCPGASLPRMRYFLESLRTPHPDTWRPLVMLHPRVTKEDFKPLASFPHIYWVQGSPVDHGDLQRAGARDCSAVVVLSDPDHSFKTGLGSGSGSNEKHENYLVDYNQIISAFSIDDFEKLVSEREREREARAKKLVIVELIFGINGKFMRPSAWDRHQRGGENRRVTAIRLPSSYAAGAGDAGRNLTASGKSKKKGKRGRAGGAGGDTSGSTERECREYRMLPAFAAGRFFAPTVLEPLLFQTYFQRYLICVFGQLVSGGGLWSRMPDVARLDGAGGDGRLRVDEGRPGETDAQRAQRLRRQRRNRDKGGAAAKGGDLRLPYVHLMKIPSPLFGASYLELFRSFVTQRKVLPMGLYRRTQSPRPYVYMNPRPQTRVNAADKVYVLIRPGTQPVDRRTEV